MPASESGPYNGFDTRIGWWLCDRRGPLRLHSDRLRRRPLQAKIKNRS